MTASHLLVHAKTILQTLNDHGHAAYIVGGYVRDRLLHRPTKDIDIATSARPEEVMEAFDHTVPTGLQHGTVTVLVSGIAYEVTTFRREEAYIAYRRPSEVHFITDLEEDLKRRDFTINAMAMDLEEHIIDPFKGQADLRSGIIRTVGDPFERFKEDALRMMRCIRFASAYDFEIEVDTWSALTAFAPALKHIAMERVRMELERTIEGPYPARGFQLFLESKLLKYSKEEQDWTWDKLDSAEIRKLTLILDELGLESRWVFLMLIQGLSHQAAQISMQQLTFTKKKIADTSTVLELFEWLNEECHCLNDAEILLKTAAVKYSADAVRVCFQIMANCHRYHALHLVVPQIDESLCLSWIKHAEQWLNDMPVFTTKDLAIGGKDLKKLAPSGPWMRRVLGKLVLDVALHRIPNEKEALQQQAERYRKELMSDV